MTANVMGSDGLIVLIIAVVVLFGGSQLPKLAKNVGAAGHEFRKAQREAEAALATEAAAPAPSITAPAARAAVPGTDDKVVISRSELKLELAQLMDDHDLPAAG
jgi:sec-independent protein translocase protein TatA